jgi:hypothetical protein
MDNMEESKVELLKRYGKYGIKSRLNCEMIGKIQKKSKLNSETWAS